MTISTELTSTIADPRRRSRLARGIVVTALALITMTATASPAAAHDDVAESTPEAGDVLTVLPDQFLITTSAPMLDLDGEDSQGGSGFGIEVTDANGLYYGDGCVTVDGSTMAAAAVLGEAGEYTLTYQFVSGDGHALSDSFRFEWAPEAEAEVTEGSTTAGDCNGLYVRNGDDVGSADSPTALVIGGAIAVVAIAIAATLIVVRRRAPQSD